MRELRLSELEVVAGGFVDPFRDPWHDPFRNPWNTPGFDDNCPNNVEECKQKVDDLIDSKQDRCRSMGNPVDRAICWAETEQERGSKYRECERLYGDG